MIKLEKMSVKQPELNLIAEWRNESMIGLRSSDLTAKGESQERWVRSFDYEEKYYFIYCDDRVEWDNFHFAGYCGLDKIDPIHRTAEMSLLISPSYRNLKLGAEAVEELLRMAFKDFNLNCVFIEVIKSTTNWMFWQKQGFKLEGLLRQRYFKNGEFFGSTIGSMTHQQYDVKQEEFLIQ